jgi:hypothetical protein
LFVIYPLAKALVALTAMQEPLSEETKTLEEIYPKVKTFYTRRIAAIRHKEPGPPGQMVIRDTTNDNKDCAYVIF